MVSRSELANNGFRTADAVLERGAPDRSFRLSPAAPRPHLLYDETKRALDIVVATILLAAVAPVLAVAIVAVWLETRANPFYRQERLGYRSRPFRMLKIRTMVPNADAMVPTSLNETMGPTFKARRDPRVTRVGAILRKTSLDELPQLLHVLSGKMTLVGPRPPLANEVALYRSRHFRRLSVKPGLTCIWQVSGRSRLTFRTWMSMDEIYIRKRSLWFDLYLLARTPWALIAMKGAW